MKASMTSRERVNCAMTHKPHDRVPRFDTFWDDTLNRWAKEGLVGGEDAAHEALQADMIRLTPFIWPAPYPDRREILSRDGNTLKIRDEWGGIVRVFTDHQTTPEHLSWDCDSMEAWQHTFRTAISQTSMPLDYGEIGQRHNKSLNRQLWSYIPTVEPFECLRKLIGDEEFMMALIDEPGWIAEMSEVMTSRIFRDLDAVLAHGIQPDGLWIYGDMAYNHSTFCSPGLYKEIIWPQHRRMCDWAHARGMKTIYHTDGNAMGVIDLLVEAGVDTLQPLECKANMTIDALYQDYGSKLCFFGNIDVMVLISGDLDAIEKEISEKFSSGMQNNGYIYHSDHSVPPQVSWELYQYVIRLIDKYGDYTH